MQLYSVEQSRSQVCRRSACFAAGPCCWCEAGHSGRTRLLATGPQMAILPAAQLLLCPSVQNCSLSQALEAHAAAFTQLQLGGKLVPVISFAQKTLGAGGAVVSKLHVIELGQPGQTSLKKSAELFFPPEFADDFPVSMQIRWAMPLPGLVRVGCRAATWPRGTL